MQVKNRIQPCFLMLISVFLLLSSKSFGQQRDSLKYRNFSVYFDQRLKKDSIFNKLMDAVKNQIDIVNQVNLSDEALTALQKVPLDIISETEAKKGSPGAYNGMKKRMIMTTKIINTGNKPILLHELMHAYQHSILPKGKDNKTVLEAFDNAAKLNVYNKKSHMMSNVGEYFACFATTYLYGVTGQEPFSREKIKTNQPELCSFFQNTFGEKSGSYVGKL